MSTFVATTNQQALEASSVRPELSQPTLAILRQAATKALTSGKKKPDFMGDGPKEEEPPVIIQSSTSQSDQGVKCYKGLLSVILQAYNTHHHLTLRPDDVWQAILVQFGFYVTGHAEELRDRIVDFQGKKELVVRSGGSLFTADFAAMANEMATEQIAKNIKDASVVEWLMPNFTTTKPVDRVAAAISVMATMQKYFDYKFCLLCGIPSVTLLGTVQDWEKLRQKIDGLLQFELSGKTEITKWHEWLAYIGDELVKSANGKPAMEFWNTIVSHIGGGSGPRYVSGWASVFAVWSEEGTWNGGTTSIKTWGRTVNSRFPIIDDNDLPEGMLAVPVTVDDNGKEYKTKMIAGQMAMEVTHQGKGVQPRTDWAMFIVK